MGMEPVSWIALAGLAISAVGAGVSYSAQSDAAKTSSQFGLMNAQAQAQASRQQAQQAMLSAEVQAASARAGQKSANNNAAAIQAQTEADSRIAQQNIRRSRDEFARTIAAMNAKGSDSGVLQTTGSPLDFLVAASQDEQLYEEEQGWAAGNARAAGLRSAEVARAGGDQLALNASLYSIQGAADMAAGRLGASQARLAGYGSAATAAGMRSSATAGALASAGQIGMSAYDLYRNRTPRTTGYKAA